MVRERRERERGYGGERKGREGEGKDTGEGV